MIQIRSQKLKSKSSINNNYSLIRKTQNKPCSNISNHNIFLKQSSRAYAEGNLILYHYSYDSYLLFIHVMIQISSL